MMTNRKLLALLFLSFAFLGACSNTKKSHRTLIQKSAITRLKKEKTSLFPLNQVPKSSSSTSAKSETSAPKLEIPAAEQDLDIAAA